MLGWGLRTKRTRGNCTCFIWTTAKAWSGDCGVVTGMKGKDKSRDLRNTSVQGGEIILVCFVVHKGSASSHCRSLVAFASKGILTNT